MDVRKFFPSIDHAILQAQLSRKISDEATLALIDSILESGRGVLLDEADKQPFIDDDLVDMMRPKGLPIGNLTSQFWANVFLNPLDHFIKRTLRCKGYVRYVDDMQLFAHDKQILWEWKQQVETYLNRLRLHCHAGAHPRPVTEGFGFLGFRIFPEQRRLKQRKGIQYQQHLKSLLKQYGLGIIDEDKVLDSVMAWNNHAGYGNTIGLRKQIFSVLPSNIATLARTQYEGILARKQWQQRGQ